MRVSIQVTVEDYRTTCGRSLDYSGADYSFWIAGSKSGSACARAGEDLPWLSQMCWMPVEGDEAISCCQGLALFFTVDVFFSAGQIVSICLFHF